MDALRKLPEGIKGVVNIASEDLVISWQKALWLERLLKDLPHAGRWAAAGASLGTVAAVAGAVVAPPVAFLPLLSQLPTLTVTGAAVAGGLRLWYSQSRTTDDRKTAAIQADEHRNPRTEELDRLFRGGLLTALLLELAGSSEDQLLRAIHRLLQSADKPCFHTLQDVEQGLKSVQAALDELAKGSVK